MKRHDTLQHRLRTCLLGIAALAACALFPGLASAKGSTCDKACLTGIMDNYLAQLLRHDAKGLPLKLDVPARENTRPVTIGQGTAWTSVARLLSGITSADASSGQVVYFGAAEIDAAPYTFFVRLKVSGRQIAESEIMYMDDGKKDARKTVFPRDNEGLARFDELLWSTEVPAARRSSRERMMAIANAYLDALNVSRDDGRIPFSPRCERYESGLRMTNNHRQKYGGLLDLTGPCADGVNLPPDIVASIGNRRFFVADEASGVVVAAFVMRFSAKAPLGLGEERAMQVYELYKIVDGQIRQIDANTLIRLEAPYHSGFADSDTSSLEKLPVISRR
ncbi:hypothetical protein ACIP1T_15120 [Pseudomonas japonica]|uniref:hypothetical protein n=1 Tax=Pseudomonas japonica TaxID=256466 RepID=UPI00381B6E54